MKKRLLNYIFPILFLVGLLCVDEKAQAQITVTSANTSGINGTATSPLISGATGKVLFGFTLTNTTLSAITINQFVLGASQAYVGNAYLYRTTAGSTSYSTASSIQSLGSLGTYISINVTQSIPALSSYTYFIVGDLNSIPGYVTLPTTIQFSFSSAIQNSPYNAYGSGFNGTNYTINNPTYTVTSVNTTGNGITASPAIPAQTGIVLFGFGISANATTTVTGFNINSSSTQNYLSYYLGNGKLYRSTSSTFSVGSATLVASGANVSFSNYQHTPGVTISNLTETITGTTVYYFLVADFNQTSGTLPATIQFSFQTSLSNSIVQSSPNSANVAVSSNITGLSFTLQNPTYTITGANSSTNGITQGTLTPGQTGIVLYGFGLSASSSTTVSEFHLYNTYNQGVAQAYFNNGKIYRSSSSTFSLATATQITGVSVSFGYDNNSGISVTGMTESVTTSTVYYFIVGDFYSSYYGALSATSQFSFKTSMSNSIVQTSPISSNITVGSNTDGTNFSLGLASISVTGYNSTSNGISTGPLAYGQTGIVLFGFGVTVSGSLTFSEIDIPASISANGYFTNGKLYRSTTPYFSNASPVSGASVQFTSSPTTITGLSETLSSFTGGTPTYYYFLVGDFTAGTSFTAPTSIQYNFANGTTSFYQASPYRTINTPSTTNGTNFSIINIEKWTGATDNDFTKASNFQAINGGGGTVPGSTMVVQIGTYTTAPNIAANTSIGGLSIVSGTTPTITVASGKTLTLNSSFNVLSSATLNLTGPGGVTIASGTASNLAASSTLNISGMAVSNAGTFSMASTSTLNLSGTSTVTNTGTFTLISDASGTARVGSLPSTSSLSGTYVVQRYFTGGSLANRGYRLMSSPVQNTTHVPAQAADTYNFSSLKTNLLITGTGGSPTFDQPAGYTANGPTILFYTPTSSTAGTFSSPAAPTTSVKIGSGFYFFFRGDNVTNLTNKVVKSGTYAVPESGVVGLQSGTLNQQGFNYTLAAVNGGYNLLGNPYPSSITLNSTALTATSTTQVVYTYTSGGTSVTAHSVSGSNTWSVASGQGFFVKAPSGSSGGTVAFTESLKSAGQPALLMGAPATTQEGNILLQMVQDSSNYDYAQLRFMDTYDKNYIENEDADDLSGSGQVVFFGAMTADNHEVAIASQPLDKKKTSVFLSVNDNSSGTFKINRADLSNIPDKFDVWLIDHFKTDSINLRNDSTYTFTIDKSNAATYGNSRMEIVVRTKVLPPYQLLTFTGKRTSNNNVLNWTTKNEYTYTSFALERSFDNKTFEGVNNSVSTGSGSYTFTDQTSKQLVYYRLKQTDINENVTYSSVIILKSDDSNVFSVYPNPTDNILHFALTQDVKTSVTLRIYNSMGTLMKIKTYTSNSGDQDVSNLTTGGYMAEIVDDSTKKLIASAKFIKL